MATFEEIKNQIVVKSEPIENNIPLDKWDEFEQKTHLKLPPDYIKFINLCGTGRLCQLIWILNPFAKSNRFNLISFLENKKKAFYRLEKEYDVKYPYFLFSNGTGLLPFAFTDNDDTFYWNIKKKTEEPHIIVILDGRNTSFEEHNFSFSDFLDKALNKSLGSKILIKEDIINKDFDPLNSL